MEKLTIWGLIKKTGIKKGILEHLINRHSVKEYKIKNKLSQYKVKDINKMIKKSNKEEKDLYNNYSELEQIGKKRRFIQDRARNRNIPYILFFSTDSIKKYFFKKDDVELFEDIKRANIIEQQSYQVIEKELENSAIYYLKFHHEGKKIIKDDRFQYIQGFTKYKINEKGNKHYICITRNMGIIEYFNGKKCIKIFNDVNKFIHHVEILKMMKRKEELDYKKETRRRKLKIDQIIYGRI